MVKFNSGFFGEKNNSSSNSPRNSQSNVNDDATSEKFQRELTDIGVSEKEIVDYASDGSQFKIQGADPDVVIENEYYKHLLSKDIDALKALLKKLENELVEL